MPKDYAPTAAKAQAMLAKFGLAMTLKRQEGRTFAPGTGAYSGGMDTEFACTGLIQAPHFMGRGERWLAGIEVQVTDKFFLLAASDLVDSDGLQVVPGPGDRLVIGEDEDTYVILVSMPLEPGGVKLLYRVLARK